MSLGADALRRRLDKIDAGEPIHIYFVESDERNMYRLPDGPEVLAEIAAIEARDPKAHIIQFITVDGEVSREEAAIRVAALRAARMAEDEAPP